MMNFGKNRAKLTTQEENHIKFSDVAGLKEEKEEIAELMYKTVRKLEAMTDTEFEELYIMPDGMMDD